VDGLYIIMTSCQCPVEAPHHDIYLYWILTNESDNRDGTELFHGFVELFSSGLFVLTDDIDLRLVLVTVIQNAAHCHAFRDIWLVNNAKSGAISRHPFFKDEHSPRLG
jgi:hypothetical protein